VTTPILLHNDLQCKNVIRIDGGGICFIDFEDATIEHRLILVDAVNILFDKETLTLHRELLESFWDAFSTKNPDGGSTELFLKEQVRICLMRTAIAPCSHAKLRVEDRVATADLLSLTLDSQKFDEWWSKQ